VEEALRAVLDEGDNYRLTVDTVEGPRAAKRARWRSSAAAWCAGSGCKRTRLTICVNEAYVDKTVRAIEAGARTGEVGDGKVFVLPLDEVVRIRTGERGGGAI
jgi:nitrogen regulatory protein PII